jgi:hypothetical protein
MMDTFLNVGNNEEITEGLARQREKNGLPGITTGAFSSVMAWPLDFSGMILTPS